MLLLCWRKCLYVRWFAPTSFALDCQQHPLESLKRRLFVMRTYVAVTMLLSLVACSASRALPVAPASPGPDLTFIVRVAGQLPVQELTGVRVTGIARDGRRLDLGKTFAGKLTVRKGELRSNDVQLVLFCHPSFHCSAYDIAAERAEGGPSLFDFDEWDVELAPIVIY